MSPAVGGFRDPAGEVSLASLSTPLQPQLEALDDFLRARVDLCEEELREMLHYTFAHSGKRLRPLLVFMSGYRDGSVNPDLVKAAAVVEQVHLATLVHDDILDDADLRHKAATAVSKYGAHTAVLLGDALFADALSLAAEYPTPEICRAVAQATRRVCAGEIGQTFQRGNDHLSLAAYMRVIEMKTADLFAVSCYVGALLANPDADFPKAAEQYGLRLGTAYQIFDDVADLLGDEDKIGKTLGTDLASGKFTLPLLYLLEGKEGEERRAFAEELRRNNGSTDLKALMDEGRIVERVRAVFDAQLDAALDVLKPYEGLTAVTPLRALVDFVRKQFNRVA